MIASKFNIEKPSVKVFIAGCLFLIVIGCLFRVWHINQNEFVFYDEGFYLNHNRAVGEAIKSHYPLDTANLKQAFMIYAKTCLASGKSLWFMVADARIFFGQVHEWFWARILAAIFGILTLFLTYCFASRFFQSRWIAWLSAVFLAILPSHIFYSRIGLQEAFSTFLVLLGFYFYIFSCKFSWRTFVAGLFFGLAFFSNYRLIMLPALIGVAELWLCVADRRWFDLRKYVWCVVTFFAMVFGVGGTLFGGVNTFIIFAWVFHQQHLAGPEFHIINFLSYPYYLVRLEHWSFALMFFGSLAIFRKERLREFLPFILVIVQMAIFSLPEEKGARYLCVVFPFMAMSVAYLVDHVFRMMRTPRKQVLWCCVVAVVMALLLVKSYHIAEITSSYDDSVDFLMKKNSDMKFVSTQKYTQSLFVSDIEQIADVPASFRGLVSKFADGYQYLILGPQAYMSFPEGKKRFALQLESQYEYILRRIEPVKVYDHFDRYMMERFVLEHSSNLLDSTEFLRLAESKGFGKLYIYDLKLCIPNMVNILKRKQMNGDADG